MESFGTPTFSRPPKRIRWRYVVRYAIAVAVLVGVALAVDWFVGPDLPWYGPAVLLFAVPPAAHLKWKHRGYWLGEDHLLTRNGFWNRTVTVVPYYRIQTVIDSRTIFQRRWNVATVVADTAGGSSLSGTSAAAVDFELDEAIELRETLQERLQSSLREQRDRRDRFEWFEGAADEAVESDSEGDVSETVESDSDGDVGEAVESDSDGDSDETAKSTPDADVADGVDIADAGADVDTGDGDDETNPEIPDDGVIRPDFSTSERDYSEPAERIDTGEYAVDRFPSDADVAHRGDEPDEASDDGSAENDGTAGNPSEGDDESTDDEK